MPEPEKAEPDGTRQGDRYDMARGRKNGWIKAVFVGHEPMEAAFLLAPGLIDSEIGYVKSMGWQIWKKAAMAATIRRYMRLGVAGGESEGKPLLSAGCWRGGFCVFSEKSGTARPAPPCPRIKSSHRMALP